VAVAHGGILLLRRFAKLQIDSGFAAESDLGSIDTEHLGIASGSAACGGNSAAGKKAHFHEAPRDIIRKIQVFQNSMFPFSKLDKGGWRTVIAVPAGFMIAFENELH
jgi:hypothetical protein